MRILPILVAGGILLSIAAAGAGAEGAANPASASPLAWAQLLVKELRPENTSYQHRQSHVAWRGIDGALAYESHTDCSGFLNALLERAYGLGADDLARWFGKKRPFAITYHDAIAAQKGFTLIERVDDIRPGDVIAIRYPDGSANTGHVVLAADFAQKRKATRPYIANTEQWQILVIDSSQSGHGNLDTRRRADGLFNAGVGEGLLRLYANQAGQIVGYAWSTFENSDFYAQSERHLLVGRLRLPITNG